LSDIPEPYARGILLMSLSVYKTPDYEYVIPRPDTETLDTIFKQDAAVGKALYGVNIEVKLHETKGKVSSTRVGKPSLAVQGDRIISPIGRIHAKNHVPPLNDMPVCDDYRKLFASIIIIMDRDAKEERRSPHLFAVDSRGLGWVEVADGL